MRFARGRSAKPQRRAGFFQIRLSAAVDAVGRLLQRFYVLTGRGVAVCRGCVHLIRFGEPGWRRTTNGGGLAGGANLFGDAAAAGE